MTDRSLPQKRGATPRGAHRRRRFGRVCRHLLDCGKIAALGKRPTGWNEDVEHGLLALLALAASPNRRDRRSEGRGRLLTRGFVRKRLSQREKQRSIERPRRAADFHHEFCADGLEEITQPHRL